MDVIENARKFQASVDEAGAGRPDPWARLRVSLKALNEWSGDHPGTSAYVGQTEDGDFFGGVHVGGEQLSEWEDGVSQVDGKTPEEVLDGLVSSIAEYIERTDKLNAELRAET